MTDTIVIDKPAPATVATPDKKRSILTAVEIAKFKAAPVTLTAKLIAKLAERAAPAGQRVTIRDVLVPGLALRLTDKGHLSYILAARYPGSPNWTRRELAGCNAISLEKARDTARDWIELLGKGIDPRDELERLEKEEARKRADTFMSVVEEYIRDRVVGPDPKKPIMRKRKYVSRVLKDVFGKAWGEKPIVRIERGDVVTMIKAKKRKHRRSGGPEEARSQLAVLKAMFVWALGQDYGLERSPCSDIKAKDIIGVKTLGDRILRSDELRALWIVASNMPYPIGPIYQLLMLSALRKNEVVRATRSEFNLLHMQWIIPASRMKGRNVGTDGKKAKPHLIPLTAQMIEIFENLPRLNSTDLLFSTSRVKRGGEGTLPRYRPVWVGSKIKKAVDIAMLEQLRKIAAERGDDPAQVKLAKWTNHDIRRTVRSTLPALKVQEEVSEAILSHAKIGINKIYNLYEYQSEKLEALELWAARLREIVTAPVQPGGDVVNMRKATS
jgi:integrase